jgi:hypothetical protein
LPVERKKKGLEREGRGEEKRREVLAWEKGGYVVALVT